MDTVDTDSYRKRTLVVLPLDHPEIREIEVNVLEDDGDISEIYERVFQVSNISSSLEVVDTIYVEFCKDGPSPKMFNLDTPVTASHKPTVPEEEPPRPPPRPGKPGPSTGAPVALSPAVKPKPRPNKPVGASTPKGAPVASSPAVKPKPRPNKPVGASTPKGAPPAVLPKPKPIKTSNQPLGDSTQINAPLDVRSKPNVVEKRPVHPPVVDTDDRPPVPSRNPQKHKAHDKSDESHNYYNPPVPIIPASAPAGPDDYELPGEPKQAPSLKGVPAQVVSPTGFVDLASMNLSSGAAYASKEGKEKSHKRGIFTPLANLVRKKEISTVKPVQANETTDSPQDTDDDHEPQMRFEILDINVYDEVKEEDMLDEKTGMKRGAAKGSAKTAIVKPMTSKVSTSQSSQSSIKPFIELNCSELVERLNLCKMYDLAKVCEKQNLDGVFFKSLTHSQLESALHLQKLDLLKLLQMRDKNWIPND